MRGQHLKRSFEHVLDEGGMRRCHLRGQINLTKRYKVAAACFNLSLLLRKLIGIGTTNQWNALTIALLRHAFDRFAAPFAKFSPSSQRLPANFRHPVQ